MDPFSVSIGVLTIIDACSKSYQILIKLYGAQQLVDIEVSETLVKLKTIWHKTETQMGFLKKIWDTLDSNFQTNQILLLSNLERKLTEAIKLLNSIIGTKSEPKGLSTLLAKRGTLKKTKYAFSVKDSLDRTVSELLEWRSLFDPSWYLLSRVGNSDIDRNLEGSTKAEPLVLLNGLRKSVRDISASTTNLPSQPISTRDFLGTRLKIASSSMSTAPIEGRVQNAIVDVMPFHLSMDTEGTTRSVMALCKALSRMEPSTFGLLRCCGIINKIHWYEFVFEIPRGLKTPQSLRALLNEPPPSLNVKIELAKQLAKSVFYIHAVGFVHKNIRPETIVVFDRYSDPSLFLCGFENFRRRNDGTVLFGDGLPEREIYRHPLRQGNNPERRYIMQHDIYSLGVCLLEIGVWKSFVRNEGGKKSLEFEWHDIKDHRKRAFEIKKQILLLNDEQLAQCMGERFKGIVENCLTSLDDNSTWSPIDSDSAPEVEVGVDFIENVLLQLHEIVV